MGWVRAAAATEVTVGKGHAITLKNQKIALFRTGDGEVYALEDVCPHMGFPLHNGRIKGKVVTCTHHGVPIDLETGVSTRFKFYCVKPFALKIEHGDIWLDLD